MSYDVELAMELNKRNNVNKIGAIVGTVVNSDNLTIAIMDGQILLKKEHLYICSNLLKDYAREFQIDSIDGNTNSASNHSHTIADLKGNIKLTKDYLKVGDKVMLIATENGQKFFLIDKVVM